MYQLKVLGRASVFITAAFLFGCSGASAPPPVGIRVEIWVDYQPDVDCIAAIKAIRETGDSTKPLYERYQDLRIIDIHNHGAAGDPLKTIGLHEKYFIDRTVLFGNISEPSAVDTDWQAWVTYTQHPDKVYPFFAGIPLRDEAGITLTVANLEEGYFGIGEIVGASRYSPVTSQLPWKAQHPNEGILPELYQLSAKYHVPVLLHIDPPVGEPVGQLEQTLDEHPHASIIFGHANAYNTPANIEALVSRHPNLYIDFFAGFTAYNADSTNELADYVPLMEKYPEQFMVSTDSGYGVGEDLALQAIYALLDLLTPETACKVAHQNMDRIIESQPPTETQIAQIEALSQQVGEQGTRKLNKRMASELLLELRAKLSQWQGADLAYRVLVIGLGVWVGQSVVTQLAKRLMRVVGPRMIRGNISVQKPHSNSLPISRSALKLSRKIIALAAIAGVLSFCAIYVGMSLLMKWNGSQSTWLLFRLGLGALGGFGVFMSVLATTLSRNIQRERENQERHKY